MKSRWPLGLAFISLAIASLAGQEQSHNVVLPQSEARMLVSKSP
jgi:hypothetical protein